MITLAYVLSACAGLFSYVTSVIVLNFVLAYYGGMFGWKVGEHATSLALILMVPFLIPTFVSSLALIYEQRSQSRVSIYQKLLGICGLAIGLLAVPTLLIDADWEFGATIFITAVAVASPLWVQLIRRSSIKPTRGTA